MGMYWGGEQMQTRLIILRKERKVKQGTLAKLLGISVKQYSYKENGKAKFNGDEMFKIADYFNLKINDIFLPSYHQNGEKTGELLSENGG